MKYAEKGLLQAVLNRLRSETTLTDPQVQIEHDERLASIESDTAVKVLPGGWSRGPRHNSCGGINDLLYSVDILVAKRVRHVARDRVRNKFINESNDITELIDLIYEQVDWRYEVNVAANALILTATGSTDGFIEPLRFLTVEKRPREIDPQMFASGQTQPAAIGRIITFDGARRITKK